MTVVYGTQMKHASKQVNNQKLEFWTREVQTTFKASFPNFKIN
jgi:hypothetical protein